MMLTTHSFTLEAKQMGRRAALVPSWTVELPLESPLTLHALLETIVKSEVDAYNTRQRDAKFVRALTETDIEAGAERGKINPGGREVDAPLADTLNAQREAIQAFKDGLYYVFLNDTQLERLEDTVDTSAPMRLLFLRLVALAGG
jgi:hypothetical protein